MFKRQPQLWITTALAFVFLFQIALSASEVSVRRGMWSYDRAEWGDGRFTYDIEAARKAETKAPASGWLEYDFSVSQTGWYTLWFKKWGNLTHEVIVDSKPVYFGGIVGWPGQKLPKDKDNTKSVNLPLAAGKHTFRIQRLGRVGFPKGFPDAWELRPAESVQDRVSARMAGFDVVRVGETVDIDVTGGASDTPATYTIVTENMQTGTMAEVARVRFPAGKRFVTRTVKIPAEAEGVYQIRALCGDIELLPSEFRAGRYVVIDTKAAPKPGNPQKELLYEIDCVKQTVNGKPVEPKDFVECNGKTTIVTSDLGTYRESSDGRGQDIADPDHPYAGNNFPGFSYRIQLTPGNPSIREIAATEGNGPFLLEVDYPDDNWRHLNFMVADYQDPDNLPKGSNSATGYHPPGGGVVCGGVLPLSHNMHTYRGVFYTNYPKVLLSVVSQRVGFRAAASKIRVYQFTDKLPPQSANRDDGRVYLAWHEQANDYDLTMGTHDMANKRPDIVNDFIALKRWAAVTSYTGMNGIGPSDVSYQSAYYKTRELAGFMPRECDTVRIATLLCEKYGMKYIPNIFLAQSYFRLMVLQRLGDNTDDVTTWSCQGLRGGEDVRWTTTNVLHPAVQEKLVNIFGELADKLRDSPAFAGISARFWQWLWEGDWAISSIYWGYGDWTISAFEKDTGIQVPGNAADPKRFQQRFDFLTGAEMKAKWIAWRTDKVMSFYERLRDRIRGDRQDIAVYFSGVEAVDTVYNAAAQGKDRKARFLGMGVDLDRLKTMEGIALLPIHQQGRGKTRTALAEQSKFDEMLDPAYKALGMNRIRAIQFSPQYDEWGRTFPLERLGFPLAKLKGRLGHYCSTSIMNGRYDLERAAIAMADMDCMVIWDGSFRANHGIREIRGPWLAEYKQIPRVPFDALPEARDPVAVWTKDYRGLDGKGRSEGYYFYVVNRERYPISIRLTLDRARRITRLGTGETIRLDDGKLALTLQPFELIAYKARAGARITAADTTIPPQQIDAVKNRLAFAQRLGEELNSKGRLNDFTAAERKAYNDNLSAAWEAFRQGHIWRARTALTMAPMMTAYQRCGKLPEDQYVTAFPKLLMKSNPDRWMPEEPYVDAAALKAKLSAGTAEVQDSSVYNKDWRYVPVLNAKDGNLSVNLDVPSQGFYQLTIGHVADAAGPLLVSMDGKRMPVAAQIEKAGIPAYTSFPAAFLPAGKTTVKISSAGTFGVYALTLVVKTRSLPSSSWSTIGPFKSFWDRGQASGKMIKQGFDKVYPPEATFPVDLKATYKNAYGNVLSWTQTDQNVGFLEEYGPNFSIRCGTAKHNITFSATHIKSPDARKLQIFLACDWWADLYVNGKKIESDLADKEKKKIGANFTTWEARPVVIDLQSGWNELVVKTMGGSLGSSLCLHIADQKDLVVSATKK
jgi:hypothetical protein